MLDVNESTIFVYEAIFHIEDARAYQDKENLKIKIVDKNGQNKFIQFPELESRSCYKIILTEKFEIKKKKRVFWEIE